MSTSFWHDRWSDLGVLSDVLGERGIIDMGIGREMTVYDALNCRRRTRRHRVYVLNEEETEMDTVREKQRPEGAFITWLAMQDHLSTMDKVARSNQGVGTSCVLCNNSPESHDHLFFKCIYSSQVWNFFTKGILHSAYTTQWSEIKLMITDRVMGT